MRDEYTERQAVALLAYVEVKLPGFLDVAEQTLRRYGMWPAAAERAELAQHDTEVEFWRDHYDTRLDQAEREAGAW